MYPKVHLRYRESGVKNVREPRDRGRGGQSNDKGPVRYSGPEILR